MHMVQYKSHTDKMLHYIKYALYWINKMKEAFGNTCQTDAMIQKGKNKHFNFQNSMSCHITQNG